MYIRDRPFNLKGGGYGILFPSEFFFRTTQELEYLFFFQTLALDYMTKTLNQIIFFFSTKIRIFFSATLGIRIFFLEKNHNPPPFQVKWSFPKYYKTGRNLLIRHYTYYDFENLRHFSVLTYRIRHIITKKSLNIQKGVIRSQS